MPLYEYTCDSCSARFELIRKFSDPPLDVCPTCGGAVQKLISSPAFQFKGSGFYATDYTRKSDGPTGSGDGGDSPKPEKADKAGALPAAAKDSGTAAAEKPATPAAPASSGKDKSGKDK